MARAFQGDYDFYILKKDLPIIKAGAVFYWDQEDKIRGSVGAGCLKLCWTPEGNCYGNICGDTIVFHAQARHETSWFELYEKTPTKITIKEIEDKLGYKIEIVG